MAIQIGGTTVINNSRQLQNIATLDSTTAATIGAAAGGGHGAVFEETFSTTETNWQPKIAGDVYVMIIGGGGSGAISNYYSYLASLINRVHVGGGGSAGAIFHKFSNVSTSQAASTITVGVGGSTTVSGTYGAAAGQAGTSSSITIGGVTLTAGGGGAGDQVGGTAYGLDRTAVGGAGGTASGGNIANYPGSAGSSATETSNTFLYNGPSLLIPIQAQIYAGFAGNGSGGGGVRMSAEQNYNLSDGGGNGYVRVMYAG
jgi:hypothetical protein